MRGEELEGAGVYESLVAVVVVVVFVACVMSSKTCHIRHSAKPTFNQRRRDVRLVLHDANRTCLFNKANQAAFGGPFPNQQQVNLHYLLWVMRKKRCFP